MIQIDGLEKFKKLTQYVLYMMFKELAAINDGIEFERSFEENLPTWA